jgi:hypothetical protein
LRGRARWCVVDLVGARGRSRAASSHRTPRLLTRLVCCLNGHSTHKTRTEHPSRMLSTCQRVTRNSGSPTHTHTHTSEAKLGTPPLSHMISLCLVYCSPSATCCGLTRPHRQCSRSPRRVPSIPGALSYFQMDFSHLTSTPFSRWPWAERGRELLSLSRARESQRTPYSSRGSAADEPL